MGGRGDAQLGLCPARSDPKELAGDEATGRSPDDEAVDHDAAPGDGGLCSGLDRDVEIPGGRGRSVSRRQDRPQRKRWHRNANFF